MRIVLLLIAAAVIGLTLTRWLVDPPRARGARDGFATPQRW